MDPRPRPRPQTSRCPICASAGIEEITTRESGPWFEVANVTRTERYRGYACAPHAAEHTPEPFSWPDDERGLLLIYREGDQAPPEGS